MTQNQQGLTFILQSECHSSAAFTSITANLRTTSITSTTNNSPQIEENILYSAILSVTSMPHSLIRSSHIARYLACYTAKTPGRIFMETNLRRTEIYDQIKFLTEDIALSASSASAEFLCVVPFFHHHPRSVHVCVC